MDMIFSFQASRIIAKLACWSKVRCPDTDLSLYLGWLKAQLVTPVGLKKKFCFFS